MKILFFILLLCFNACAQTVTTTIDVSGKPIEFVLDPKLYDYKIVRVDLLRLFQDVNIKGTNPDTLQQAKDFINTSPVIFTPYMVKTQEGTPAHFEGNHRLRALLELGATEAYVAVPWGTDIKKFPWIIEEITHDVVDDGMGSVKCLKNNGTEGVCVSDINNFKCLCK